MIRLFNSLSSKKDNLESFKKNIVKIFVCGPTLYDRTHLGHARIFLTYDLLCRHLQERGYETDVLVNMTDINQHVFQRAIEEGKDYDTIAKFYAQKFIEDLASLNIKSINRLIFVSDYVKNMVGHIINLLDRKFAYSANGNIYLDTTKMKTYGMLSKQSRRQLQLHRLDIGPNKKNQEDIMLWNCSDDFAFTWESDIGRGIPWWHIQDTVVAIENFGNEYDIHGGARELVYPHHEAHLAQYKLFSSNEDPVKIWMYVGLVLTQGEKMSKSLGNVVWSSSLVQKHGQNLLRLYIYSKHYGEDMHFEEEDILAKKAFLKKIVLTGKKTSYKTDKKIYGLVHDLLLTLDDDLNSPKTLEIFEKICDESIAGRDISSYDFGRICRVLGINI